MAITYSEEFQNNTGVASVLTDYRTLITQTCLAPATKSEWFTKAAANGGNVRVYLDSAFTIRLSIDLVAWDSVAETFVIWTKYPSLGTVLNKLYLAVDDAQVEQPAVTAAFGRNAVWSDYERVFHMGSAVDSSGNGDLVLIGSPTTVSGVMGGGMRFNGINQRADLGWNGITQDFTLSAVMRAPNLPTDSGSGPINGNSPSLDWNVNGGGNPKTWLTTGSWTGISFGALIANTDYWLSTVYDGTTFEAFVDGSSAGSAAKTGNLVDKANFTIASHATVLTRFLEADIFFVAITLLPRSADWQLTEYNSQSSPGTFWVGQAGADVGGGGTLIAGQGTALSTGFQPTLTATSSYSAAVGSGGAVGEGISPNLSIGTSYSQVAGTAGTSASGILPNVVLDYVQISGMGGASAVGTSPTLSIDSGFIGSAVAANANAVGLLPNQNIGGGFSEIAGVGLSGTAGINPNINLSGNFTETVGFGSSATNGLAPALNITVSFIGSLGQAIAQAAGLLPTFSNGSLISPHPRRQISAAAANRTLSATAASRSLNAQQSQRTLIA